MSSRPAVSVSAVSPAASAAFSAATASGGIRRGRLDADLVVDIVLDRARQALRGALQGAGGAFGAIDLGDPDVELGHEGRLAFTGVEGRAGDDTGDAFSGGAGRGMVGGGQGEGEDLGA